MVFFLLYDSQLYNCATFVWMSMVEIEEIKERGDWRSDCIRQYKKSSMVESLTMDLQVVVLLDQY